MLDVRRILITALAIHTAVCLAPCASADEPFPVHIRVDAANTLGELKPIWRFFGADEPNYAYMKDGAKLLGELGELRRGEVFFRTHNLLTTGDGTPALKWGSTNAYTEDANGKPIYDWTIVDRIFDTYLARGVRPYVQIGFMPKALSMKPEPYQHHWTPKAKYDEIYTGWAYPPKDYAKWGELVLRVGEALRGKVRRRGSRALVLGDVERAEHRLLARHAGGVLQAPRLRHRRGAARDADRAKSAARMSPADPGGKFLERISHAPLRDWPGRHADRFHFLSRERRAAVCRWPRADGHRESTERHRRRLRVSSPDFPS